MSILPTLRFWGFFLHVFFYHINGDVYLHVPRGSNNRLIGEKANRQNANRVFDSQNNAKGGYNVGEQEEKKTKNWYHMQYFMSGLEGSTPDATGKTVLPIEWTNQHGCGDENLNCNIVLQYQCRESFTSDPTRVMRNGKSERTPLYRQKNYKDWKAKARQRQRQVRPDRVLHELWEWYDKCAKRQRNQGLFTADQKLKGTTSKYTRQNPNGNRHGYECPEERDYYPYWHPTGWIDIAVLANKKEDCTFYKEESFNTKAKGECLELYKKDKPWEDVVNTWQHYSKHNNKVDCVKDKKGIWVEFRNYLEYINKTKDECKKGPNGERLIWDIPYRSDTIDHLVGEDPEKWKRCLVALDPPDCRQAPQSRPNHLGNGENVVPLSYDWTLPRFPSQLEQRCVLRIRYNISTNDYNPKTTFADSNGAQNSPIVNDPEVEIEKDGKKVALQLAINTAQFGRTFQDRSHVFKIIPREEHFKDKTIYNLNVRGKRGNIVQVYPAVEYDFAPNRLEIKSSDYVHIQWTGSNTNPANNDGEGRKQTDRSNIAEMAAPDKSYPFLGSQSTMFDNAKVIHALDGKKTKTGADIAIAMATAGYFPTASAVTSAVKGCDGKQAAQLDCFLPSYSGLLLQFEKRGTYYYMCSRNNNFTNRSQKGRLIVD